MHDRGNAKLPPKLQKHNYCSIPVAAAAPSLPEKIGSRSSCLLCISLVTILSHLNCLIKESMSMYPKKT